MKVLRIILVLLGLLALLIVGIGFFGPSDMNVSHKKVMKAPLPAVWEQVVEFKNWPNWSPWAASDPEMKITYSKAGSRGLGGGYSWEGPKTGKGEMEIREIREGEKIGMDIGFDMGGGMEYSTCDMQFKEVEGGTEVTWNFESSGNTGFGERLSNVIMPSILKGMYEEGLNGMEKEAIANPFIPKEIEVVDVAMEEVDMPGLFYIGKRYVDKNIEEITAKMYTSSYRDIFKEVAENGEAAKLIQPPVSVTEAYDNETKVSTFTIAMMSTEKLYGGLSLATDYIKPHKAMIYRHKGSYERLPESYEAIMPAIYAKGLTPLMPSYELCLIGPITEPDDSKWVTQIVIPLEWIEAM